MRVLEQLSGLVFLVVLLMAWELSARLGMVAATLLPAPSSIAMTTLEELNSGELTDPIFTTARHFIFGFLVALIIAIPSGFALGRFDRLFDAFEPIIEFLRPMPVIAILPIVLFVLGFGDRMVYAMVAFGAGWIMLLHAMDGVRSVDPVLVDTARTLRISSMRLFLTVIIPAAAPQTLTGVRVSLGVALTFAVVVELIAGFGGLGTYIGVAQGAYRIPETYSGIVLIGILGYAFGELFLLIERKLITWQHGLSKD